MRSSHISQQLSAYCHGELVEEESRRVAEHLIGCQLCRREFEEIKLGIRLAEQLPRASAPANLWSEIEAALEGRERASSPFEKLPRRRFVFGWQALTAACCLLILTFSVIWFTRRSGNNDRLSAATETRPRGSNSVAEFNRPGTAEVPSETAPPTSNADSRNRPVTNRPTASVNNGTWAVARLAGAPKVGTELLEGDGQLAVGQWLETDASSRAQISVADIGHVEIEPNSRVQLIETSATEHRLAMTHGRLHAMISAPPRLFIVETPSAKAVDLGCSYTLEVDKAGRSVLHVTSGWVALELKGRESVVPAGAYCVTQPGKGVGTPYFDNASKTFREALARLDFESGGARALTIVLAEARESDTLTLWHLLSRVSFTERGRIYERMAALVAPPEGVTREGVLKLDKKMLDLWKQGLEWAWFE